MSRKGKQPISIPKGVSHTLKDNLLKVKGPKGELEHNIPEGINMEIDQAAGVINVSRASDVKRLRALHGLTRALVYNMFEGVSAGYQKVLDIVGTGYSAQVQGSKLVMRIGFCLPIEYDIPKGIKMECPLPTKVTISGIDKQLVGEVAAVIRRIRPPEPYHGKGIRYDGENVRIVPRKTFGAGE